MSLDRNAIFKNLFAMDTIVHSLSDGDLMEGWFTNHVPDGCDSIQDIEEHYSYMTDEELAEEYENTAKYFARLVKEATKDGYDKWTSVGWIQPQKSPVITTEPRFKAGQKVHLKQIRFWNVGKHTYEVKPDMNFIVVDTRENIFDSKKTVYDIQNENIGTISVDEDEIAKSTD